MPLREAKAKKVKKKMKKATLLLLGAICLLCASCEKEETDPRDAVVGRYNFTQTGSATIAGLGMISLDDTGTFTISKNTSTTTGLYIDGRNFVPNSAWIAGTNTLCLGDATGTYTVNGIPFKYTVAFSPCQVHEKTFTVLGTITGSGSYGGTTYSGSGTISITATSK